MQAANTGASKSVQYRIQDPITIAEVMMERDRRAILQPGRDDRLVKRVEPLGRKAAQAASSLADYRRCEANILSFSHRPYFIGIRDFSVSSGTASNGSRARPKSASGDTGASSSF